VNSAKRRLSACLGFAWCGVAVQASPVLLAGTGDVLASGLSHQLAFARPSAAPAIFSALGQPNASTLASGGQPPVEVSPPIEALPPDAAESAWATEAQESLMSRVGLDPSAVMAVALGLATLSRKRKR